MKFFAPLLLLGVAAGVRATIDCISTCESSAASDLNCDTSDTSCFCQTDFATKAKACLYSNSSCGKSYVAEFYSAYGSSCSSASSTAAASNTASSTAAASVEAAAATSTTASSSNGSTGTTTSAAATATTSTECISTCETSAAASANCDINDLTTCYCSSTFTKAAKACLYSTEMCGKSYVSQFYSEHDGKCSSNSTSSSSSSAVVSGTMVSSTVGAMASASGTERAGAVASGNAAVGGRVSSPFELVVVAVVGAFVALV